MGTLSTSNLEAERLNRAVITYDFIYLLIAIAATMLFVFETLFRVFNLYSTTNGQGRKRRKKRRMVENQEDLNILALIASTHESL